MHLHFVYKQHGLTIPILPTCTVVYCSAWVLQQAESLSHKDINQVQLSDIVSVMLASLSIM